MAIAQTRHGTRASETMRAGERAADDAARTAERLGGETARLAEEAARHAAAWATLDWRGRMCAFLKSNEVMLRSLAAWHEEMARFAQTRLRHSIEMGESLSRCRSAAEAFERQSDYARTATEQYAEEAASLLNLMAQTARDGLDSMQGLMIRNQEEMAATGRGRRG